MFSSCYRSNPLEEQSFYPLCVVENKLLLMAIEVVTTLASNHSSLKLVLYGVDLLRTDHGRKPICKIALVFVLA